ncbi:MAG: hypothetical protein DRQ10_08700 [Candidatus Hydrothermota bacterium]|nr:MAG: hypothetical protein DRQ10_08700 [Candidatus Hydrothermae bacterium]
MGYPVVDVRVEILEVGIGTEYTPLGTREAVRRAMETALQRGEPKLLEPYVEVDVYVPAEFVGNVINDLGVRGGELLAIENVTDVVQNVKFKAPLRKMFGYANVLRSITEGRGSFQMRLSHFAPVEEKDLALLYV